MLASAQRVKSVLGTAPLDLPHKGSGPSGAPITAGTGGHWITARDIIAHAYTRTDAQRPREWRPLRTEAPLTHSKASLRPYQADAVAAAMPQPGRIFRSGVLEIGCGLGKTYVGGELIRQARPPAVVITQHSLSVNQWMTHLKDVVGLEDVHTLASMRHAAWRPGHPLPEVLVLTYNALSRAATTLADHVTWLTAPGEGGEPSTLASSDEEGSLMLLWLLHCVPFCALVLDEVHLAAADHFQMACRLRAGVIYGLSGSLVREDGRLGRLEESVGPVLFRYHAHRGVTYEVIKVPLDADVAVRTRERRARDKVEHALRALNPCKVAALRSVLATHATKRILVFCDSQLATAALAQGIPGALGPLHGGIPEVTRRAIVAAFAAVRCGVLVAARVCDAAVDFPDGCLVVQMHVASGSRQQEVQRCGRGSRSSGVDGAHVIHIVNRETEEERFVERRVAHVRNVHGANLAVVERVLDNADATLPGDHIPLQRLSTINIPTTTLVPTRQISKIRRRKRRLLLTQQQQQSH